MTDQTSGWFKSSYSTSQGGNCVETCRLPGGRWEVRDSKDQSGAVLCFSAEEWKAFTAGVRDGEFD
jgi:putative hemolysin